LADVAIEKSSIGFSKEVLKNAYEGKTELRGRDNYDA